MSKKNYSYLIILWICFSLVSCKVYKEPIGLDFINILFGKADYSKKLSFAGYYSIKDTNSGSEYFAKEPIYFFNNNTLYYEMKVSYVDSMFFTNKNLNESFLNSEPNKFRWGVYKIIDDTIKASIYCEYTKNNAQIVQFLITNFEGVVINKNEIINWRMVPPFPNLERNLLMGHLNLKNCLNIIFSKNLERN